MSILHRIIEALKRKELPTLKETLKETPEERFMRVYNEGKTAFFENKGKDIPAKHHPYEATGRFALCPYWPASEHGQVWCAGYERGEMEDSGRIKPDDPIRNIMS